MRDPKRIKPLLELIESVWKEEPELRLCQLLWGATSHISFSSDDLFNLEDDELFKGLKRMNACKKLRKLKAGKWSA